MEIVLLLIIMCQTAYIVYNKIMQDKPIEEKKLTEEEKEIKRKEKIEKSWQKLFNYNETIATKGYEDE